MAVGSSPAAAVAGQVAVVVAGPAAVMVVDFPAAAEASAVVAPA